MSRRQRDEDAFGKSWQTRHIERNREFHEKCITGEVFTRSDAMTSTDHNTNHEHLGDGVYASFDGYQIWLDLRGQDDHTAIALEPRVMQGLIEYAERVGVRRVERLAAMEPEAPCVSTP